MKNLIDDSLLNFKDLAHLYIGCEILISKGKINILSLDKSDSNNIPISALTEDCKPLLRAPEDMTTKEIDTFIDLMHGANSIFPNSVTDAYRYACSIHVDSFSFIKNNKAIRKTN